MNKFVNFEIYRYSHFYPFHLDAPRIRGLIQGLFHDMRDGFPLGEDLRQVLRAQNIPQGGRRQQVCWVAKENGEKKHLKTGFELAEKITKKNYDGVQIRGKSNDE